MNKIAVVTQRTWFITGVNSGFGRYMTEQLLARGDRVAGTVRKMDAMNDLKVLTERLAAVEAQKDTALSTEL